jgi:hypothetical protein
MRIARRGFLVVGLCALGSVRVGAGEGAPSGGVAPRCTLSWRLEARVSGSVDALAVAQGAVSGAGSAQHGVSAPVCMFVVRRVGERWLRNRLGGTA